MGFEWGDPEDAAYERQRRRETRNRALLSIGITLAICAVLLRTCVVAHEQAGYQRAVDSARALQDVLDRDRSLFNTPHEQEAHRLQDPPAATAAQLEATTRVVCRRMLACGGRSPTVVDNQLDKCVEIQTRNATTSFARSLMAAANQQVLDGCGELGCDRFPTCYLETMQELAGNPRPTKEVSPEVRTRFVELMCQVADENAGNVPDLHGPDPSPKTAELSKLMNGLELATIAELTKEALASCAAAK